MLDENVVIESRQQVSPVVVSRASDGDADAWLRYVDAHPQGTVFHDWGWRRILQEAFGHACHFLVARRGEKLVGVLPLAEVKTLLFGHSLSSLPFAATAGVLCDDEATRQALDRAAIDLATNLKVEFLEYRERHATQRGWPKQDLYFEFRKAITADHDANLNAIPRKQRAMVRKGIRNGLASSIGDAKSFFALYADNVHRHGTPPHSIRYFDLLLQTFGARADVLMVNDATGAPVSTVLTLYHRDEAYPLHAGDYVAARDLAANDFKYWELMRRSADRGLRVFNFGRSKLETGPYEFKRNWGFEPAQLSYEYHLLGVDAVPQNNPLNPKYRLMIETWRRLPRPVVNWLGPKLIRGLG